MTKAALKTQLNGLYGKQGGVAKILTSADIEERITNRRKKKVRPASEIYQSGQASATKQFLGQGKSMMFQKPGSDPFKQGFNAEMARLIFMYPKKGRI